MRTPLEHQPLPPLVPISPDDLSHKMCTPLEHQAKMGLVLESGAHFQKGCVSHFLFKYTPPLGAPAATF